MLGPLLFIIYINDLPEYIKHCKVRLFADDCVLYRPIFNHNDTLLVQADLHALESWSKDWLMNFNASKCHSMKLSRNSIDTIYYFNSTPLTVVDHFKYLGVILQSEVSTGTNMSNKKYLNASMYKKQTN